MSITNAQKEANLKYRKEKLKRIPLDVQKEKYEEIAAAAASKAESVNGYSQADIRNPLRYFLITSCCFAACQ